MTSNKKPTRVEWMCTQCGQKVVRSINSGRPMPGRCSRRDGKPHRWVMNRKF